MSARSHRTGPARILPVLPIMAILVSCATLQVPLQPPSFPAGDFVKVQKEGVLLEANPIEGRELYWELFDDNLPEIGIVAVWITVENQRSAPIDGTRAAWVLNFGGSNYGSIEASEVLETYRDGRNRRMVGTNAEREALLDLNNIIYQPGSVAPGLKRDGFLFFKIREEPETAWSKRSTLLMRDFRLEDRSKIEMTLRLSHDSP